MAAGDLDLPRRHQGGRRDSTVGAIRHRPFPRPGRRSASWSSPSPPGRSLDDAGASAHVGRADRWKGPELGVLASTPSTIPRSWGRSRPSRRRPRASDRACCDGPPVCPPRHPVRRGHRRRPPRRPGDDRPTVATPEREDRPPTAGPSGRTVVTTPASPGNAPPSETSMTPSSPGGEPGDFRGADGPADGSASARRAHQPVALGLRTPAEGHRPQERPPARSAAAGHRVRARRQAHRRAEALVTGTAAHPPRCSGESARPTRGQRTPDVHSLVCTTGTPRGWSSSRWPSSC